MIRLQQSTGGVIDSGHRDLIPDFGLQQAQLGPASLVYASRTKKIVSDPNLYVCCLGPIVLRVLRQGF